MHIIPRGGARKREGGESERVGLTAAPKPLRHCGRAQHRAAMPPLTPDALFARLDALGIAHRTYTHPPVFTVEEAKALRGTLPGGHCKSLFLKDKKGGLWLVVALEECRVDLKALADRLAAPRFSFGSAALLYEVLGVRPGSVTPFAAINDTDRRVVVVMQRAMLARDPLNYHPLKNDRTTAVAPGDLVRFLDACGHAPRIVDIGETAS
jgi:Ala-tRNA(Pro) deacylase